MILPVARPASPHIQIREDWLASTQEAALGPDLLIVDAHHHLWDRPGERYLFPEFLADTNTGHRIAASVFVQCRSMYRAGGPETMRPVGEIEFANGVAAQSASGQYGPLRACAGIVGPAAIQTHLDSTKGFTSQSLSFQQAGVDGVIAWANDQPGNGVDAVSSSRVAQRWKRPGP